MPHDVFISHASEDAGVAAEVCALLEARGVHCWIAPRDVAAGAVWDEAILDAIEQSRAFLLILSKSANDSQFVKNEVNRAFSERKPIVTFRLEDVAPGRSLQLYLARHHWTDAFPPPLSARVETLADSITALLDGAATKLAASAPAPPTAPAREPFLSRLLSPFRAAGKQARSLGRTTQLIGLVLLAILVAIGSLATWYLKPGPPPARPAHLVVELPPGDLVRTGFLNVALSPDGTQLAYVGIRGGVPQLFVRALDSPEAKAISGTDGAVNPFFSPDGQWIGFFAQGKMKKVSPGGGAPQTICDAGDSGGASWGPDDTIIFAPSNASGLQRVSAAGGEPKILTTPDPRKSEYSHRYPQILPGGKAVLFTALGGLGWDESRIEVLRLDTGERRVVVRGGMTGRYVPTGHLVYVRAGALLAVPFDLARLEATSDTPVTIADGILQSTGTTGADYAVSAAGTLAYIPAPAGSRQFEQRLAWVDREGMIEPLPAPPRFYSPPALLSPDGKRVAVAITSETRQIWIYDLAQGTLTQLTSEPGSSDDPLWSPDGKRVAYRSNRAGSLNLYWRLADGSGQEERLTTSDFSETPLSFSPDGKLLSFAETDPTTKSDIWILPLEGDRKPQPFLRTPSNEGDGTFSPDGHWLAYQSDESGGVEVYVQPYPGPGKKWQVSTAGGVAPFWNPNGRELFYQTGDKTMVVDVTTSPTFTAGKPRLLYVGPASYSSPDGRRFLAIQPVEPEQPPTQINLVLNWFEELKQKVSAGNR